MLLLKQFGNPVSEKADPRHGYYQGNGEASERQDAVEHCLHGTDPCLPTSALRWRLVHLWQSPGTLIASLARAGGAYSDLQHIFGGRADPLSAQPQAGRV
jgi:hypothetical protein